MKLHTLISLSFLLIPLLIGCGDSVVVVSSTTATSTLDDSTLRFVSIQSVQDLMQTNITPPISQDTLDTRYATISPDGERIIAQRSDSNGMSMCTYLFATDATTCTSIDERIQTFFGGFWSPDNRYLVLNLDRHTTHYFRDTDIWIYDTQENRLINRTDDGVHGGFVGNSDASTRIWLDMAPVWSPNGDLYFFRNRADSITNEWRASLMRIPAEDIIGANQPEMILHDPANNALGIYRFDSDWLEGTMTISPDGRYLAYSNLLPDSASGDGMGIWIIDLAQKSVKAHLSHERFASATIGLPDWWGNYMETKTIYDLTPRSLAWSADSNTLVTLLTNLRFGPTLFIPFFKYDVSADTFQTIYDYRGLETWENLVEPRLFDDLVLSVDNEISMAIASPTQKTVFYLGNNVTDRSHVLSAMSIIDGGFTTPVRIHTFTDITPSTGFISISYDGTVVRIIVFGELITLAPQ